MPMTAKAIFSMIGLFLMMLMNMPVANLIARIPTNTPIVIITSDLVNDTEASMLSMLKIKSIISIEITVAQKDFLLLATLLDPEL